MKEYRKQGSERTAWLVSEADGSASVCWLTSHCFFFSHSNYPVPECDACLLIFARALGTSMSKARPGQAASQPASEAAHISKRLDSSFTHVAEKPESCLTSVVRSYPFFFFRARSAAVHPVKSVPRLPTG
ncbi:unnamed protein product [Periconia digitata]|uniref:Uncharacterized protein n=1 Tax=Periconia digitata TaxID=1303443 RepID=A0A9W4XE71_9PLEO|nr:unnamed protein product [Periconia digitata]